MPSLYEIDQAIIDAVDMETGEILDPEKLDGLLMDRTQKIENIALYIKNLQSDAAAFEAEKKAFEKREKAAKATAEWLKGYLARSLGGADFSTTKCAISWRKSERVEIPDASLVPKKWLTKTITYKPDKNAIKEAIKGGQKVKGCRIVEISNPQIT